MLVHLPAELPTAASLASPCPFKEFKTVHTYMTQRISSVSHELVDYGQLPWGQAGKLPRDPFLQKMCVLLGLRQVGNCCAILSLLVALLEEEVFTEEQLLTALAPPSPTPVPEETAKQLPAASTSSPPSAPPSPTLVPEETAQQLPAASTSSPPSALQQPAEPHSSLVPGKQLAHMFRGAGQSVPHKLMNNAGMTTTVPVSHWGSVTPRLKGLDSNKELSEKDLSQVTLSAFAF